MWFAGVGWGRDGYELVLLGSGGAVAPPVRFDGCSVDRVVDHLRALRPPGDEPIVCVIDSTNGVIDGSLTVAGFTVYRADPDALPPRPAAGSVGAAVLAEAGRRALARLSELDSRGTLAGRGEEIAAAVARAAALERELVGRGQFVRAGRSGTGGREAVALTFDDGPSERYTGQVLDVLRRYGVSATFFCVGLHVQAMPALVRRIADEGHGLGNHTWSHPYLPELSRDEVHRQLDWTDEALRRAGGYKCDGVPRLVRPPYGGRNPEVLAWLADRGTTTVLWTVNPDDWAMPGAAAIADTVLGTVAGGSIVLMHDGGGDRSQTVAALPAIVESLLARGYDLVPVDRLC